ncbi:MAG TPA: hypothetical protein VF619_05455 [Allosphingosinicella sp.]|jgi:hypothetical protein
MGRRGSAIVGLLLALASCGKKADPEPAAVNALDNVAAFLTPAADPNDPNRRDAVLGLSGTEAQLGAVRPDCSAFPLATGPRSLLGLTPGMTLPQASSTLRCQFPDMKHYDTKEVYYHSFTGIRHGPNVRMSFGVQIPATSSRPTQQIDVYLAGGMNRERVFAIRTEAFYGDSNRVPIETVTKAVADRYGPLDPRYYGDYSHAAGDPGGQAVYSGLGQPADPFCMSFIGTDYLNPDSGGYNEMNIPWEKAGACGTKLYYKPVAREGLAEKMKLLLIDFSLLPALHAQEVADAERASNQARDAEMENAKRNAERGAAPRL